MVKTIRVENETHKEFESLRFLESSKREKKVTQDKFIQYLCKHWRKTL